MTSSLPPLRVGRRDDRCLVSTTTGLLQGLRDAADTITRFLGVPYAQPPLGALRFRPPVPIEPWNGVLSAQRFGPASAQVFDPKEASYAEFVDEPGGVERPWVGSEDSLTLNIWTPGVDGRRPVLIWIHGGANWLESSRLQCYHGDKLVARGDVVFVSLNYRLGIFGFLDLSVLGDASYARSHSNGLHDQLTALEWVKRNIAAFGGDPDNITLMGESAGSRNIAWLLASGRLDELVRRVVMMSGVATLTSLASNLNSEVEGRRRARDFLARLGVRSMTKLLAMSTDEILERHAALARRSNILFDMDTLFWSRIDGQFIATDPFRAARAGQTARIDVMIGYTAYEMGLWLLWDDDLDKRSPLWAAQQLAFDSERTRESAASLYAAAFPRESPGVRGMHLLGDERFVMPASFFAEEHGRHNPNVWMYQFDWEANWRTRALHAADQCFLFDKLDAPSGIALVGAPVDAADAARRQRLVWAFQDAVLAFARSGDPNKHENANLPAWPRYDAESRQVMRLNVDSRVESDPLAQRRQWWQTQVYGPAMEKSA